MTEAEITIAWPPLRVAVGCVASYLGCAEEDARLQIVRKAEAGWVRARGLTPEGDRGLTPEGDSVSLFPASWRGIDWDTGSLPSCEITNIKLCRDDLIAADLLPGRSEGRKGWWADQTLAWIIRRELEWTSEMGKEIKPAQLKLSEAIAARRINLWGRQPGSLQIQQISNDLFSPSKYKMIVTPHRDLSTEPSRKRHEFEEEYKDDSKWRSIIFAEDEIRREWLPAGRAAPAHESAEVAEKSMPEPVPAVEPTPEKRARSRGPKPGTVKRYASADRELFDEVRRLVSKGLSLTAATQELAESGRVAGVGNPASRARRLAKLFKAERSRRAGARRRKVPK